MEAPDTTKYFVHASYSADGVVERSDVVGAIYGQTEGLLGDGLDLRELQRSDKVGRMEVEVESSGGSSYGTVTIGSSLDRVETSVLAASLETIERIGPCSCDFRVELVEDVRTTKRKEVVDRAKRIHCELFDDSGMSTDEMLRQVRESVRKAAIDEYAGLPAGPKAADSDAVVLVEGRADVLNLLQYGVKNAVAVEGTDVPEEIGEVSRRKTVTAFLDDDRGGELLLKELVQVADVDFVARPPEGCCVEDLTAKQVNEALRGKVPLEVALDDEQAAKASLDEDDGGVDKPLKAGFEAVRGTDEVKLYTAEDEEVATVRADDLPDEVDDSVEYAVFGGDVSQEALDYASRLGVSGVVAEDLDGVVKKPLDVNVVRGDEL